MDLDLNVFDGRVSRKLMCDVNPLEEFPVVGFHIGRPALSMDV